MILEINSKNHEVFLKEGNSKQNIREIYSWIDFNSVKIFKEFCRFNIYIPGLDNRRCDYKVVNEEITIIEFPDEYLEKIGKLRDIIKQVEKRYIKIKKVSPFEDGSLIRVKEEALK